MIEQDFKEYQLSVSNWPDMITKVWYLFVNVMYTLHKHNYKWSNYYNDNIQFDVSIAWRSSTRKIKSICKNVMQSPLLYIDYIHMMVHEHTYILFHTSFCISYPLSISHCVCQNALCNSIFLDWNFLPIKIILIL